MSNKTMQNRRGFLKTSSSSLLAMHTFSFPLNGMSMEFDLSQNLIKAPQNPEQWPAFRSQLEQWRINQKKQLKRDHSLYENEAFEWTSSCFSCCFLMMVDEMFYDPEQSDYKVRPFLDHGQQKFGGFDSVVLWHAYPRIGLDERNQFDFYRDMHGGLEGLRNIVKQFHQKNVKVFINWNPWDRCTRREEKSDIDLLVEFVVKLDADGIFLDTLNEASTELRDKLDAQKKGVALESELALPVARVHDHHMSWAQWFNDSPVPGVLRNKWFERRHMQHQIKRWNRDHTSEIHSAWMNGSGMMVWENVFGTWVGWNPRDASLLRAMLPIQRRFSDVFSSGHWTPLVKTTQDEIFASRWRKDGIQLWTLINRSNHSVKGNLLPIENPTDLHFYDLIQGIEIQPNTTRFQTFLAGEISPRGIGCFLARKSDEIEKEFALFLKNQSVIHTNYQSGTHFPERHTTIQPPIRTKNYDKVPEGMASIPSVSFTMNVTFRIRECGFYDSTHPHFDGPGGHALHRPIHFERDVELKPYAIDITPVTNEQFYQFLQQSNYQPKQQKNFLKHWMNGKPPEGKNDHPVVYVDLNDARAYAQWAGKRLPTEEEWQFSAQGYDGLKYPWGNEWQSDCCNQGKTGNTTSVRAYPQGRSPFGIYDLCGNTWEWTESERRDGRTRFCILKGGSYYQAQGSAWYMDGGPQTNQFACKFLLMWPGLDRCSTIGFRCVTDRR